VARTGGAKDGHAVPVVRLFPGWAESSVWFDGPVAYEDTGLDDGLVADLRAWDDSYYAAITPPAYAWPGADLEARHLRAAARLARRIADEVGDEFEVEHDPDRRRVRASGPPSNDAAAAAFRALAARAEARRSTLQAASERARAEGHVLFWSAEPPPSGPVPGATEA
jgi:hypothetical protein